MFYEQVNYNRKKLSIKNIFNVNNNWFEQLELFTDDIY